MFGCYNCSVLRSETIKEEIKKELEQKAEELKAKAEAIGMKASVSIE